MSTISLGSHIAARLVEIGVTEYFCVPGDFNMTLLDQLNACKQLKMVNCCNELEAGYAADGYARAKGVKLRPNGQAAFLGTSPDAQPPDAQSSVPAGVGCLAVTFTVGGLSAINAVAGAYAEDLPVICITGVTLNCLHMQLFSMQQTNPAVFVVLQVPNSNDFGDPTKTLHHTTAGENFNQEYRCFQEVTVCQVGHTELQKMHV